MTLSAWETNGSNFWAEVRKDMIELSSEQSWEREEVKDAVGEEPHLLAVEAG